MGTAVALLMVGCGDSAPECGSNDVKNMITDGIYTDRVNVMKSAIEDYKQANYSELVAKVEDGLKTVEKYKFNINNIVTESSDDKAKRSSCSAEINTVWKNQQYTWNIKYNAYYSADGKLIVKLEKKNENDRDFELKWFDPDSTSSISAK